MLVWTQENVWNRVLLERGTKLFIVWTGLKCPMIKELAWDTNSTENFWLNVHSYNNPMDGETTWSRNGVLSVFNHVSCYHWFGKRRCMRTQNTGFKKYI